MSLVACFAVQSTLLFHEAILFERTLAKRVGAHEMVRAPRLVERHYVLATGENGSLSVDAPIDSRQCHTELAGYSSRRKESLHQTVDSAKVLFRVVAQI